MAFAVPDRPPPPAHSLCFSCCDSSEQGTPQLADWPPGVGSGHAPLCPCADPRSHMQPAQPCDVSHSHMQTPKPVLHSSSPGHHKRHSLGRSGWKLFRTELHCSQGQKGLEAEGNLEDREPRRTVVFHAAYTLLQAKPTSCLGSNSETQAYISSFKTDFGWGC